MTARGVDRLAAQDIWVLPSTRPHRGRRGLRPAVSRRMCRPDLSALYQALVVADVDLDTGSARALSTWTPFESTPEGVHAVVWFHGEPVGELTVPGDPEELLPLLAGLAERELQGPVLEHRIRDALATPGGVRAAAAEGPDAVAHPRGPAPDASQVTVAVCTRGRPEDLALCLGSIAGLTPPPAGVLVVDNAPCDERTRAVAARFPFVRYVREPRQGLDWARNRALLEARTPIVAFADDDVLVHPRWVAGLVRAFVEEPDAVGVTGLVVPAELATPAQVAFEATNGFGRGYRRQWRSVAVGGGEAAARSAAGIGGMGTGANMAFRREPVLELGGFDPALDVGTPTGGAGDLELMFRLVCAGHSLVYEPSAVVRHRHRRTMAELRRQRWGDGAGLFSMLLGAGGEYGRVQRRWLRLFALRWFAVDNLRALAGSLFWRRVRSPSHALAKAGGSLSAVSGQLYVCASAQALEQAARHPSEPSTPSPLARPPARRAPCAADGAVTVDVVDDGLVDDGLIDSAHPSIAPVGARTQVHLTRAGRPHSTITVRSGGARLSSARLRWEVAERLGPAVIGADAPPAEADASAGPAQV